VATKTLKLNSKWTLKNKEEMVEKGELKKTPKINALGENERHT
jgi:hypothetical protein